MQAAGERSDLTPAAPAARFPAAGPEAQPAWGPEASQAAAPGEAVAPVKPAPEAEAWVPVPEVPSTPETEQACSLTATEGQA